MPLIDRITAANDAIRPLVPMTPLQHSPALSARLDCTVLLKCEHVLPTGSFKLRGATNKLHALGPQATQGVLTASTGNHGMAVAHAGARLGIPVTVYVAASASPAKRAAIQALGATLVTIDGPPIAAELAARARADHDGRPYISPYNDLDIIAGQGTIGLELHDQASTLDAVVAAVGGGGLIGGIGTALKARSPRTSIVGAWPEASPCMLRAMQAGTVVDVDEHPTLSDGTAGAIEPGSITLPTCQAVIDTTITVPEPAIAAAMRLLAETEHWMIEGAAGVALAALIQNAAAYRGQTVAVILCGRNIALDTFRTAIQ